MSETVAGTLVDVPPKAAVPNRPMSVVHVQDTAEVLHIPAGE
jgi:hypothetical protein